MVTCAPRISARLLAALARLDNPALPVAEVNRRLGAEAARLGLTRPSYERIRVLLNEARHARRRRGQTTAQVLVEIAFRLRPPETVLHHVTGIGVPILEPQPP